MGIAEMHLFWPFTFELFLFINEVPSIVPDNKELLVSINRINIYSSQFNVIGI
jgi:hypothetical protein